MVCKEGFGVNWIWRSWISQNLENLKEMDWSPHSSLQRNRMLEVVCFGIAVPSVAFPAGSLKNLKLLTILCLFCGYSSPRLYKMETCRYALSRRNIDSCSEALIQKYWQDVGRKQWQDKNYGNQTPVKARVQKDSLESKSSDKIGFISFFRRCYSWFELV